MRIINVNTITQNIKDMCIKANHFLAEDMDQAMKHALDTEQSPLGRQILDQLQDNLKIAAEDMIPICQDTGMAVVFLKVGQDVHFEGGSLEDAVNEGVRQGYVEGFLRKSVVGDPIIRENTKDNTPAVIHYSIVPGDKVEIKVAPKGFGSEKMCIRDSRDMIRFGEDESHIETVVEKNGISYQIDMHLKKNSPKGIAINKMPIRKASELFGIVNLVFFSPEDLNIIKNGPAERRRFIDLELSQLDKVYLNNLSNYNRIVNQRNHLLKELSFGGKKDLSDTLEIWELQMVQYGERLIARRKEFVEQINGIIAKIHQRLTGGKESLKIIYEPSTGDLPFEQALNLSLIHIFGAVLISGTYFWIL